MVLFTGAATALLTPFTDNGALVDYDILSQQINWQIEQGIDALVIAGTTGETPALTKVEHKALIEFTVRTVSGRVPVIAGTGSNNTVETIEMTRYAHFVGADAALIVNPYYNKPTQTGLIAHYTAIHDATDILIILYNVPSRTGANIDPQTVYALSKLPRIIGIKEASNNFSQITEIARLISPDFALYSGNDDTIIPLLSLGGHGVISVASNIIPAEIHELTTAYLSGKGSLALQMQLKFKPLIDALFMETNPGPVKYASHLLGRDHGPLRLPMVAVDNHTRAALAEALGEYNFTKGWSNHLKNLLCS